MLGITETYYINRRNINIMKEPKYDFFICHASEDKESFVRPLANALEEKGFTTWYDEYILNVGDSLTSSIQEGIKNSLYGIIVFSKNFFKKQWAKKEFSALFTKEIIYEENILLPIWLDVTQNEVFDFAPLVADKFAINGNSTSLDEIIKKLSKKISPQITTKELFNNKIEYLISCDAFKRKKEEIEILNRIDKIFAYQEECYSLTDGHDFLDGHDGYTQEQENLFFLKEEELRKEYNLPKGLWLLNEPTPQFLIEDAKDLCKKWINRKLSKNKCDELHAILEEGTDTDTCYILYGFPYNTIKKRPIFEFAFEGIKRVGLVSRSNR